MTDESTVPAEPPVEPTTPTGAEAPSETAQPQVAVPA